MDKATFPRNLITEGTEKLEIAAGGENGVKGELLLNRCRRYEHIKYREDS